MKLLPRFVFLGLTVGAFGLWWMHRPTSVPQTQENHNQGSSLHTKKQQNAPKQPLKKPARPRLTVVLPRSRAPRPRRQHKHEHKHKPTQSKLLKELKERGKKWGRLPDGSQIVTAPSKAHHHHHSDGHEMASGGELYRINKQGQIQRLLPGVEVTEVKVAPKAGRIAAVSTQRILYASGPNGQTPLIKVSDKVSYFPAFGPKGEKLAFVKTTSLDEHELFLQSLNKGGSQALAKHTGGLASPVFHPNGKAVIFVSNKTGVASLWRIDLPQGKPYQLTNQGMVGGGGLPPHFVPPPHQGRIKWHGSWLAFDAGDGLWVIRDDGKRAMQIARGSPEEFDWKQEGRQLVYRLKQGSEEVWYTPN